MSKSPTGRSRSARPATKKQPISRPTSKARAASSDGPQRPRTRFRSRHPVLAALVPLMVVVAAIATMIVIKASGNSGPSAAASSRLTVGGSSATADPGTTALSPEVVAALSVPAATLDTVGSPASVLLPTNIGSGTVLRGADNKPLITYVGAEYCPYCAAERWALAVALSRFGTFSNLSGTHSSDSDVYPDTQTLSFYGSTYSSPYVDFQAVEETTNQLVGGTYQTLQTPTAAQRALIAENDPQGSIPFLDIANRYIITGASFSPQVLQGLSRSQIAAQLDDPTSAVAQGDRRGGQRHHRRHLLGHREPAHQRGQLGDDRGDRPEARGVTMADHPTTRRVPGWVPVTSLGLSLVAVAIASYLTVAHYTDPTALACPETGIVNCALVTTSSWSVVLGVPLAVLGLVWAVVMTGLTVPWAWRGGVAWVDRARLAASGAGALMVLYLVYVELFRIGAICLWCTAIHVTAVCLFGVILAGRAASTAAPRPVPEDGTGVSPSDRLRQGTFTSKGRPARPAQ